MLEEDIESKLKKAFEMLRKRDKILLEIDINERTLCHRLAIYLEQIFAGYDVDCEYNRIGSNDPKKLIFKDLKKDFKDAKLDNSAADDTVARTVYPDIVVHKRTTEENLLIIEIKKSTNNTDRNIDINKIKKYKSQLGYKHGVFIEIEVKNKIDSDEDFYELSFIHDNVNCIN
ncbi:hypothetical protein [Anaerosalibacter sp. Marseille-P3206]|uniref:hypothetical protein n=1 Tax=Anaerosalibacter sp. Marseille-P3206 TaxID=1871005 RepID=UPI000986FC0E|nr:hypothetical protein [Anaerosalibacter sp. Marseille-P3206]